MAPVSQALGGSPQSCLGAKLRGVLLSNGHSCTLSSDSFTQSIIYRLWGRQKIVTSSAIKAAVRLPPPSFARLPSTHFISVCYFLLVKERKKKIRLSTMKARSYDSVHSFSHYLRYLSGWRCLKERSLHTLKANYKRCSALVVH